MIDLEDFNGILRINEFHLERHWVEQPVVFFHYSSKLADSRKELKELEDDMLVVMAEIARDIREDPLKYGISKITDIAVKAAIPDTKKYKKANAKLNEKKHETDILSACVAALEHRKRALEKLVDLHGQNYFSSPRTKHEGEANIKKKSARSRVKYKTTRKQRDDPD